MKLNSRLAGSFSVLNQHGMDSKQSLELLEQVGRIIEMEARMTRGTTH